MIALVTSTLAPFNAHSFFTVQDRLAQTLHTIEKLYDTGFQDIILIDNSVNDTEVMTVQQRFTNLKVYHQPQYTFVNKGLNEALLILNNMPVLPADTAIFKISGRYYPAQHFISENFDNYYETDFIGIGHNFSTQAPWFTTRAYYVKNKTILEAALITSIEEMLSYSKGIHGLRSLYQSFKSIFKPGVGITYQLSLETALARVLKQHYNFHLADKINIEGYLAGSNQLEFISE